MGKVTELTDMTEEQYNKVKEELTYVTAIICRESEIAYRVKEVSKLKLALAEKIYENTSRFESSSE